MREGQREKERIPSRFCAVSTEPDVRLELRKLLDHYLGRNQE